MYGFSVQAVYANALRTRKEREDLELPASAEVLEAAVAQARLHVLGVDIVLTNSAVEVCENAGDVDVGHRCLGGYEFQAVVCIKLIVMDIPQQADLPSFFL